MKIKYTRNHGFVTRYLKHKIVGNAQINNIAKILLRDLIPRQTECPNGKKKSLQETMVSSPGTLNTKILVGNAQIFNIAYIYFR